MPVELVEKKLQGALPVHLVARDGLEAFGPCAVQRSHGPGPTAFPARQAGRWPCPAKTARLAAPCSVLATVTGALALGALSKTLPEGDWHFASAPAEPELAAIALALGGYRFHPLRQEIGQGAALRSADRRRCGARSPHRRRRLPGARPGQHADQRHGAGRSGAGGADPGCGAQGRSLGDQGRRSARRRISR